MNVDGYSDRKKASQNSVLARSTARPYRTSW